MTPDDLKKWYVRNGKGEMVPFSAFTTAKWGFGSPLLERFNGQPSIEVLGQAAPGLSSGDAMNAVQELIAKLPPGIGYEWSGTSYEERRSGAQAPALYAMSLLVVFLCLAALYESWSVPFAVMLVVPLGVLGALLAASGRGLSNDVYFQVGLLATIGLSSKNAILIVEFAKAVGRGRPRSGQRHAERGTHAPAPDPDDLAGLRTGRAAAGHKHRRRLRQPERDRHRRTRRHDLGHRPRPLLRADVLCADQAHLQGQAGSSGGCRRGH
jgi:uncharacterized membrane protein